MNGFFRKLRWLARRQARDAELREELQFHLDQEAEERQEGGLAKNEARWAAHRELGNIVRVEEQTRTAWGWTRFEQFARDAAYGLRQIRRNLGFSAIAIVTLALGIGANTAIFSVINAVLLQSLPFKDSDRLVMVFENNYKRKTGSHGPGKNVVSPRNYIRWLERNQVFEQMSIMITQAQLNVVGGGEPERVPIGLVSANLFPMLGIQPKLGRNFTPQEDVVGNNRVVIISDGMWQRRFGSDGQVLGKSITLNGLDSTIVGVMPRNVAFPEGMELYAPYPMTAAQRTAGGRFALVVARLKPGVTLRQARAHMEQLGREIEKEDPQFDTGWNVTVVPLREQMVGDVRLPLLVLFGAVSFVLLIGCANVANLLLARASAREREMAIRAAMGVSRWRVVQQLLTESLLLAVIGGGIGVLLAYWLLGALLGLAPTQMPGFTPVEISTPVLGFTLGISVLTGIVFGLAPALKLSCLQPVDALKEGSRGSPAGGAHRLRDGLVVAEAAITLVLLAGAGLMLKSFVRLLNVDPGFRADHLLTAQVARSDNDDKRLISFYDQLLDRIRALPGSTAVGAVSFLPLDGLGAATGFRLDDRPAPKPGDELVADVRSITADYFKAMGTPILRGRAFDASLDRAEDEVKKIIVNETAARTYWPDQDPIGKRLTMPWIKDMHAEVVGVIPDMRLLSLNTSPRSQLYWHYPQLPYASMTLVVRTSGAPDSLAVAIRAAVASIDQNQPVARVRAMEDVVAVSVKQPRFIMTLLSSFALLALLLATVGIYGVMSYSVTQRTQEMGIRMALGAQPRDVARLVLAQGMRLAMAGVIVGIVAALLLTRFLRALLFEVRSADPMTFAGISALLVFMALVAVYVPARRATRLDPMMALRYE